MIAWPAGNYHPDFTKILCYPNQSCAINFDNIAMSWYNNTDMKYCVSDGRFGGDPDNTMPSFRGGDFTSAWIFKASSLSYVGCP